MTPDSTFSLFNLLALVGWILLAAGVLLRLAWLADAVAGRLIPFVLGVVYVVLIIKFWATANEVRSTGESPLHAFLKQQTTPFDPEALNTVAQLFGEWFTPHPVLLFATDVLKRRKPGSVIDSRLGRRSGLLRRLVLQGKCALLPPTGDDPQPKSTKRVLRVFARAPGGQHTLELTSPGCRSGVKRSADAAFLFQGEIIFSALLGFGRAVVPTLSAEP